VIGETLAADLLILNQHIYRTQEVIEPSKQATKTMHNQTDYSHYNYSRYYPHGGDSSITTSVTIRVTPEHYHLISWGLLWLGFFFAILLAWYQVWVDNNWFSSRQRADIEQAGSGSGDGEAVSSADLTRSRVRMKPMCITNLLFIWIYSCSNIFNFVLFNFSSVDSYWWPW
jgi:hypothetical protein